MPVGSVPAGLISGGLVPAGLVSGGLASGSPLLAGLVPPGPSSPARPGDPAARGRRAGGSRRVIGHTPARPAGSAEMYRRQACVVRLWPEVVQATLIHCAGIRLSWVSTPSSERLLPSVTVTRLRPPGVNAIVVCW